MRVWGAWVDFHRIPIGFASRHGAAAVLRALAASGVCRPTVLFAEGKNVTTTHNHRHVGLLGLCPPAPCVVDSLRSILWRPVLCG
jgi:hypothetical protein